MDSGDPEGPEDPGDLERMTFGSPSDHSCSDCTSSFDTSAKLKYHRLRHHGKWRNPVSCPHCGKSYGTQTNLRRHIKKAHGEGDGRDVSGKKSCPECEFVSHDSFHLEVHMRKHTGMG